MSFVTDLPFIHRHLLTERQAILLEIDRESVKLNADDENQFAAMHSCTCDFCPYLKAGPVLPADDRAAIESRIEELERKDKIYQKTIKSLEGYAKMVGVRL